MPESKKALEVIKELMKETNRGSLAWDTFEIPKDEEFGDVRYKQPGYTAEYKGRILRLYKSITKQKTPSPWTSFPSGPEDIEEEWVGNAILEVHNPETGGMWQFPDMSIVEDLYSTVQQKSAEVDEWMDDILEKDNE